MLLAVDGTLGACHGGCSRWFETRGKGLLATEQALDVTLVAAGHLGPAAETTGALARLLLEQVRPEGLAPPDLAPPGGHEALRGAAVCLLLGHQAAPAVSGVGARSAPAVGASFSGAS